MYNVMWLFASGKLATPAQCKRDCNDVDLVTLNKTLSYHLRHDVGAIYIRSLLAIRN